MRILIDFVIFADQLPALALADLGNDGMKKYIYSGKFETDAVSAFVGNFLEGTLKPNLKSEEAHPDDTKHDVKVVKGSTFKDLVLNNDKDVLVEFYAPWCGHCKKLAPTWDELAKTLKGVESIVIAKSDATANEFDVPGMNIRGFPTIFFFKGNDKSRAIKYEAGREVEDFIDFLAENAATPFSVAHGDHTHGSAGHSSEL
jgi:protein disulfide-isomerase A1